MQALCWCNECYARRHGDDDTRKFDDCETQQALNYVFAKNEETIIALEESQAWELYKGGSNG